VSISVEKFNHSRTKRVSSPQSPITFPSVQNKEPEFLIDLRSAFKQTMKKIDRYSQPVKNSVFPFLSFPP